MEQPIYDHAYVRVSNNGTTWTTVWQNTAAVADTSWVLQDINIAEVADNQPTVYVRWTMGTTDAGLTYCGWNIDDVSIRAVGQQAALLLSLPRAPPEVIPPDTPTQITLQISSAGQTYAAGSGRLHYRFAPGAFSEATFTPMGGDLYQATLPGAPCTARPEFYFSATGSGGTTVVLPDGAPTELYQVQAGTLTTIVTDDFEVDHEWTVGDTGDNATTGIWDRGDPNPTAAQPGDDHTPAPGVTCWVTDSRGGAVGDYDVDNGKTTRKSPNYDLSAAYPDCNYMLADINGDGTVNAFDIDPFVQLLTGG